MRDLRVSIPGPAGSIPLLILLPPRSGRFRGTVLVYHGLGASKDVQRPELHSLAARGFLAVGVDAQGHGERRAPDFDARTARGFGALLEWVDGTAREVPAVLDSLTELVGQGLGRFGITGISMGGYIAYAAARVEKRLEAIVPILASPDWTRGGAHAPDAGLAPSPHGSPDAFPPRALLALNAGRDENVPPVGSRTFVERLRPAYAAHADRLEYVEYPESAHFMRENDWHDLWARTVGWFEKHLVEASR